MKSKKINYEKLFEGKLTDTEISWIKQGGKEFELFKEDIKEALTLNRFNDHYIFSSPPGYVKTWTLNETADELGIKLVKFDGSLGVFSFAADIASILLAAPKDINKIYCAMDDCDSLYDKGDNLNTVKGMYDERRKVLAYGKSLGPQYHMLDDIQKEAIDSFKIPGRSGFSIPMDKFVFITLTNRWFPDMNDVDKASDSKKSYYLDLAAIRRRVQFKDIKFEKGVDWGYCVHVLLNKPVSEKNFPNIRFEDKLEMIKFSSPLNNWNRLNETNVSLFDKMSKDMVKFPKDYPNKWYSQYVKK
jgi:hypothetical protein